MCPAKIAEGQQRGFIIPIGGAEERVDDPIILQRFVELCGDENANIVIIPTASQLAETGPNYEVIFRNLNVKNAISLPINSREDAEREDYLAALENATGIFITGGNQLRLSTILGGTSVAQSIRKLNSEGVHVAGTSAGAAIMPEHMIAGGSTGALPNEQGVTFAPGLGLISKVLLDQHFSQRNRLGRLLSAVSYNPFASGLGICENTAAFIAPDGLLEVVGHGSITVVDPSDLQHSSMAEARTGDSITLIGLKLHMLSHGDTYCLNTRVASPKAV
ncbi:MULTISPECIES: cyanophycinase [unclassified Colwellia]|jgi:cyanophycinase|uniref:cyanophycinase n=1 Tax=unclassified Colwellia TaxID=196834 RepID=UPI0015F38E98|nr:MULTISPECIES: cyanophycinase [unclassified Colwellia]MBA6362279.1 cyanophycinase [Colwellia sp. BRX8-8]MBA6336933.1 cyanophycinase [Colwellia sp. BRX8-7]MBA6370873.1 cyanophycinase [Colwellia sp. BRX8-4]MBA6379476.1 cyanophycinase [Colwellia sp. BRX10-7]MBA6381932.1 cyanophycinase [Colwellia sp. BRX10-9]